MQEELLFGTAYYPEYMPYERTRKDMELMKAAGMNVIRIAESTWSTLEKKEGVFDFSYIDQTLDLAEYMRLNVIIGTPTYAVPSWLVKKDQGVLVTTREGQAAYGHRQLINLWNPTFRYHAEKVIRMLLEHTVRRKHVIGFQIDNETKHYGNTGKEIQGLFRAYLRKTFKTTEELNRTFHLAYWSNSIADWDDFPDMTGCINGGLYAEFERFRRSLTAEYLEWQAKIVRDYKTKEQFITHNFDFEWKKFGADIAQDGYSYGVQPDICHYSAAKNLTIAGCDIYHPTQNNLTGAEIAFCGDSIRGLKDSNYLVLECQAQAFKEWTPYPGQLRLHAYCHLANGAAGLLYWNWHSIHGGYEAYWKGVLSHDLAPNPAYEEIRRIGNEWKTISQFPFCLEKHNKIALVTDNHSLTALTWYPIDRDLSYNDVVRWMYDCLYEMNLECDIVDVHALNPERYKMIVTPVLYSASQTTVDMLEQFVQKGGVLVSSFKSFVADEYLRIYPDTQPHLLHSCFGMSYNQFTAPGNTMLKGRQVSFFAELLMPDTAVNLGSYEHKYWGQYAAMTRNRYGKGHAYYMGCYTEKDTLKELYAMAIADAGIEAPLYEYPVIVRNGVLNRQKTVHFILHFNENEQEITSPYEFTQDLLSGYRYKKNDRILLKDWDVKLLVEAEGDENLKGSENILNDIDYNSAS